MLAPAFLLATALYAACSGGEPQRAGSTNASGALPDWYAPPPRIRTYPSNAGAVHAWIRGGDDAAIRAHGWDLWESITSPSPQDSATPVWETWYSGHEIFDRPTPATVAAGVVADAEATLGKRLMRHRFEIPKQTFHHARIALQPHVPLRFDERTLAFNRFTRPTALYIYRHRLWDWRMLADTNRAFNAAHTPVAEREIRASDGEVDASSIVIKAVFEFIDGQNPTVIPYWAGNRAATTSDTLNPIADTWKQYVIVDPAGTLAGQDSATMPVTAGGPPVKLAVIPLSRFYSVRITQVMADSFSVFAETSGDDVGASADTAVDSLKKMVKAGNLALLVAMHVTGKEIVEWTWQTFWWSPTPNDSLGADRPATIGSPWNNYQMNTAYQMVTPAGSRAKGTPLVSFNPYLETSLGGTLPRTGRWYGVQTNCMSCHRRAAWKDTISVDSTGDTTYAFTGPPYGPAAYVDSADASIFGTYTKTDFLWSVATRTRNIPPYREKATP